MRETVSQNITIEPNPEQILQLTGGYQASRVFLTAVGLDVFTTVARLTQSNLPANVESLSERLGFNTKRRGPQDFFDSLVAMTLLLRDKDGNYWNSPAAEYYLNEDNPYTYIGAMAKMAHKRLYLIWGSLEEALKTGLPQSEARVGGDSFDALYADPKRLRGFLEAMTSLSRFSAKALTTAFSWGTVESVIDIGTAQGGLPITLAHAYPHLICGGFDRPEVQSLFEENVANHGLADRLRFYPGNFFRDRLPVADVLTMGHLLHDFDMETKKDLLAEAYQALPTNGLLIIYETMIDDERIKNLPALLMSLNMAIVTPGGFDYTGVECREWLREAGFTSSYQQPLAYAESMIVATK